MTTFQPGQTNLSDWGADTEEEDSLPPWKSPVVLQRLCYEEGLGPTAIAEKLDCAPTTIQYWTDKYGIERPTLSRDGSLNPASYSITDRGYAQWQAMTPDGVRSIYVHQLLAIAEHGVEAVKDKVVHHKNEIPWDNRPSNLEVMTQSEHANLHAEINEGDAPWRDPDTLQELYVEERMTIYGIADELDCSGPTVHRWMEKHGIERRDPSVGN